MRLAPMRNSDLMRQSPGRLKRSTSTFCFEAACTPGAQGWGGLPRVPCGLAIQTLALRKWILSKGR